jgi:hypothetical protein
MREGARNYAEAVREAVRRNGVRFCYAENWIYAHVFDIAFRAKNHWSNAQVFMSTISRLIHLETRIVQAFRATS